MTFEAALKRFQATVAQIRDAEEAMKEHLIILGALFEQQHRLAVSLHRSFEDGPLEACSADYVGAQHDALKEFAQVKQTYLEHCLHPTNELLRKSMPEIHDLIEKRSTLKLDCDSYSRREAAEKDKSSAAAAKLISKRDNARQKLQEVTATIHKHLDDLERRRPVMMVSELSALVGLQHTVGARSAEALSELLPALPHSAVAICSLAHGAGGANAEMLPVDDILP